ncbi:MAG: TetM/TetW/TetO/TetS family tetracycline resistance ribosomal protection protein [Clostridia bacterium]|nr:TetM/TetW/TetO/TetS family tetracycline resistance ribosomal protection protein [Clostridia bacterium]
MKNIKNIGIFAHVDAGKTTLTEQLLYNVGAIKAAGSVDKGSTQTDSNSIERERGISIYSMPASYDYKNQQINIIDTPGHVDFVAEVQRSMLVLDGAVLVISAREGVQSHTRLLFKSLKKMNVPTLIFINKIDRIGVNTAEVISSIEKQLTKDIFITQSVENEGTKEAIVNNLPLSTDDITIEKLSLCDETLLSDYLEDKVIDAQRLNKSLQRAVKTCCLYPVMFGSALKNIGVNNMLDSINDLLPIFKEPERSDLGGVVFKIFYTDGKIRNTVVRLTSGSIKKFDYIGEDKITSLYTWRHGRVQPVDYLSAGEIGYLINARHLNIGDTFGAEESCSLVDLGKPTLKAKISPTTISSRAALLSALTIMADCDPYLSYELSEFSDEIYLNMFGRIQMEIVEQTLLRDFNLDVHFDKPMTIYMETPISEAEASVRIFSLPFAAGIALRIRPLPLGSGVVYRLDVQTDGMTKQYFAAIKDGVYSCLDQGLFGWEITDIEISLTDYQFNSVDSAPSEYRRLAPLVLFRAINEVKTRLLWPIHSFVISVPTVMMGRAINDLNIMKASIGTPEITGDNCTITGYVPAENINDYNLTVHEYTSGVGYFESQLSGYEYAPADITAERKKFKIDASNEKEYLMSLMSVVG